MIPRIVAFVFVVLGLVLGIAHDRTLPQRDHPPFAVDLHVHTRFSDGFLSPFTVVDTAIRRGLDAIAVTEHNQVNASLIARAYSRMIGGPTVLVGEEITTSRFHLLAIGTVRDISPRLPLEEIVRDVHAQGGVAIIAHPVRSYWDEVDPVVPLLDGAEVVHPSAYRSRGGFRSSDMVEFYERARANGADLAAIGSSDFHFFALLGICRTYVDAPDVRPESLLAAIRAGRTATRHPDGRVFGDPAVIAAMPPFPDDSIYAARSPLDALGRVLGLLGLLGLVVLGSIPGPRAASLPSRELPP